MRKSILLLLLIVGIMTQSPLNPTTTQQVNPGKWLSPNDSKETTFPRYLICGAELNFFRMTMPYSCNVSNDPKRPILVSCIGGKIVWQRANGIRFKYCNFEDWDDQKTNQYYGSWEWTGMKMCPKGQYVYGYMTRINQNDGLNGLILMCRNKFTKQQTNVTVRDGNGTILGPQFINSTRNMFAYDFNIKLQSQNYSYITGLNLLYTPFPEITNVEINYDLLPPFEIKAEYEHRQTRKIQNYNKQDLNFTYDINTRIREMFHFRSLRQEKPFQYSFTNFRGKYHGIQLKRLMNEKSNLKLLVPVIVAKVQKEEPIDIDRNVIFRLREMPNDFQFNKLFNQPLPIYDLINYTIPNCYRLEISSITYSTVVNNPYTLTITYTSGDSSYIETIRGMISSHIFGKPEVRAINHFNC